MARGGMFIDIGGSADELTAVQNKAVSNQNEVTNAFTSSAKRSALSQEELREVLDKNNVSWGEYRKAIGNVDSAMTRMQSKEEQYAELVKQTEFAVKSGNITEEQRTEVLKRVREEMKDQGSVLDTLSGKVASMFAAWASGTAILETIKQALQNVTKEADEATESVKRMAGEDQGDQLAQIATDTFDYNNLQKQRDKLAVRFGISREAAEDIVFSGRSEGFEADNQIVAAASQIVKSESAITVAGQTGNLFGGELGTGQLFNAVLKGAQDSRLTFDEIAKGLPGASEGGALTGAGAQETIAALSTFATFFKSGETASDRLKALGGQLAADDRTRGQGFIGGVETVLGFSDEERKKFLGGSKEVQAAFTRFSENLDLIKSRVEGVDAAIDATGTDQDLLAVKRSAIFDLGTGVGKRNAALLASRSAEVELEIAKENELAEDGLRSEALIAKLRSQNLENGGLAIQRGFAEVAGNAASFLGKDAEARAQNAVLNPRGLNMNSMLRPNPLGMPTIIEGLIGMGAGMMQKPEVQNKEDFNRLVSAVEQTADNTRNAQPTVYSKPGENK